MQGVGGCIKGRNDGEMRLWDEALQGRAVESDQRTFEDLLSLLM